MRDAAGARGAVALEVRGLMNVQFAVKDGEVYLIEVNPRASRTVPFVANAIGRPIAKVAARLMAGEPLSAFEPFDLNPNHMAVKEAVFPFARFPGADPVLSPEMKSTGEVMGIDRGFAAAFLKSQLGAGMTPPHSGTLFVSLKDTDKPLIVPAGRTRLAFSEGRRALFPLVQALECDYDEECKASAALRAARSPGEA